MLGQEQLLLLPRGRALIALLATGDDVRTAVPVGALTAGTAAGAAAPAGERGAHFLWCRTAPPRVALPLRHVVGVLETAEIALELPELLIRDVFLPRQLRPEAAVADGLLLPAWHRPGE